MKIVLSGAGASYGSGTVTPKPPPLGWQLFPVLIRRRPHGIRALLDAVGDLSLFRSGRVRHVRAAAGAA